VNESSLFRYPFTLSLKRGKRLLSETRALGVAIVQNKGGAHFNWGGVERDFLWPADPTVVPQASNDNSLLLHLTDDQVRFL
jgi:beta-lactamase superfamily II metal-dependent hydrolase